MVVRSNGKSQELELHRDRYVVGRQEGCELRIPLAAVSRKHAELRMDDGTLSVRDLGSSNGTFVNREQITGDRELNAGDLIAIGPVVLVVRVGGEPAHIDVAESLARGLPPTPQEKREPSRDDLLDDDDDIEAPKALDADSSSLMDFDFDLDDDDLDDQPAL